MKRLILLIIPFLISVPAYAVVAGGMVANYYTFLEKTDGYSAMEVDIQITHEPGWNGRTFWANQFFFMKGDGGYTGLQQNNEYTKKAIFSIWQAHGWNEVSGADCSNFSHEGSGVSCLIDYNWEEGQRYRFIWERISANQTEQVWRSSIINLSNQQATVIGEIKLPKAWKGLSQNLSQFVENFSQGHEQYPSCASVPATTNVFFAPYADKSKVLSSSTKTYGNCEKIAQSFCTSEHDCIATINSKEFTNQVPFMLKNEVNGYCADSLSGGNVMGLYHCQFNNNQKLTANYTHRLYLTGRSACLGINASNNVSVESCTKSSNQRWLRIPSTKQYLHLKSGKCMDASGRALIEKDLQVIECKRSNSQKWDIFR